MEKSNGGNGGNLEEIIFELTKEEFENILDEAIHNTIKNITQLTEQYERLYKLESQYEKDLLQYKLTYYENPFGDITYVRGNKLKK